MNPFVVKDSKTPGSNRVCGNCRALLMDQAVLKRGMCDNCGSRVSHCDGQWDDGGLGRCPDCFNFMLKAQSFCEACGWLNHVAFTLKRKREAEAHRQEKKVKNMHIENLEAENQMLKEEVRKLKLPEVGQSSKSFLLNPDDPQEEADDKLLASLSDLDGFKNKIVGALPPEDRALVSDGDPPKVQEEKEAAIAVKCSGNAAKKISTGETGSRRGRFPSKGRGWRGGFKRNRR